MWTEEAIQGWLLVFALLIVIGVGLFIVAVVVPVTLLGGLGARTFIHSCWSRGWAESTLVAVPVGAVTFWLLSMTDWVLGWQSGVSVLLGALATRLLPNKGLPQDMGKPARTLPAKAAASAWRLFDFWLTALLVMVTTGAVVASLYSRQPSSMLLLAAVAGEIGFVAWLSHRVWQRLLPRRFTVLGVNILAHGLATLVLCQCSNQYGVVAGGLALLGPFLCFFFNPDSLVEIAACVGMTLLVIGLLVPYMLGHLWRPQLRGAFFTSVGVAAWMLCGLTLVTLCIAAGG